LPSVFHNFNIQRFSILAFKRFRKYGTDPRIRARREKFLRDLWRYRELFILLLWRDFAVRYKQTVIGVAWGAVICPLLTTIVLTFVFKKIGKIQPRPGIPYFLIVLTGNLPCEFFSTAMSAASNSLLGNANLISKVYFPRLIIPAGSVITSLVDFLITLGLMALALVWFRFMPDWRLLTLHPSRPALTKNSPDGRFGSRAGQSHFAEPARKINPERNGRTGGGNKINPEINPDNAEKIFLLCDFFVALNRACQTFVED
jgi:hypothetical protein